MRSPTHRFPAPTPRPALAGAAVLALLLSGCAPAQDRADTAPPSSGAAFGHVHGIHAEPDTGEALIATHNGLYDAGTGVPVGPAIDLMGSTTTADGTLFASGHPGPGTDLPDPVGLIRSADGGRTWDTMSRAGESDFHAMTATGDRLLGFDGQLRATADGETWTVLDAGFRPHTLAGSPEGDTVLATTEQGVWRSVDNGRSWTAPEGGPVLLTAAFADADTAVGVSPDGTVYTSADAGRLWTAAGSAGVQPAAIDAGHTRDGDLHVWVADDSAVHRSTDGGATFTPSDP